MKKNVSKIGGRWRYLLEQQALTGKAARKVAWVKGFVDLAELAKLRQDQGLTISQLSVHFQVGTTTMKARLAQLRRT